MSISNLLRKARTSVENISLLHLFYSLLIYLSVMIRRRATLAPLLITLILIALSVYLLISELSPQQILSLTVESDENYILPHPYHAFRISAETNRRDIKNVGTYITADTSQEFTVEYVTKVHDDYFSNTQEEIDFTSIRNHFLKENKTPVLIVAGAFTPDNENIQGFSLDTGTEVGESRINKGLNGIVSMHNNTLDLTSLPEISDKQLFIKNLKQKSANLFQQVSYIRPDGNFSSSKSVQYELRFLIESTKDDVFNVGIIDLSYPMTYTQAVTLLTSISGLHIERAIGLDTGFMSEAHLYDTRGKDHIFFDNKTINPFARLDAELSRYRSMFTNVIVVFK